MRRFLLVLLATLAFAPCAHAEILPRVIIGITDEPHLDEGIRAPAMELAEMPLNHLGLILEPYDVKQKLPDISQRADLRGILIWAQRDDVEDAEAFVAWVEAAAERGLPVVLFGPLPGAANSRERNISDEQIRRLLAAIGLTWNGGFLPYTHDLVIAHNEPAMTEFERPLAGELAPVEAIEPAGADAHAYLAVERGGPGALRSTPVVVTSRGGFVADGYAYWSSSAGREAQWRINPFAFFRAAFHTDDLPKPDTTTLNGRRIFYAHIDGDGWLNLSRAGRAAGRSVYASEVILDEIARVYTDFPLTVAPIAAEMDPDFAGTERAVAVARAFFALPNVEPASHTYTHPFDWPFFFENYTANKEAPFIRFYRATKIRPGLRLEAGGAARRDADSGDAPRAYGDIPFDLQHEAGFAANYISDLAPGDKRVRLVQWSGDTLVAEDALAEAAKAGLLNLNGGDSRLDGIKPSYTTVAPLGRRVGAYWQIYASQANENVYTDNWRDRFYAFRELKTSLVNTERPLRLKPFNIYYHMYSGERQDALDALKSIYDFARTQELAPIFASSFAAMALGYYSAQIEKVGEMQWRVTGRGALQTIRFDHAAKLGVDPAKSRGVIGARRAGSVLYVALDPDRREATIALAPEGSIKNAPPLLIDSRWRIAGVESTPGRIAFRAGGFGPGEMRWQVAPLSVWEIRATGLSPKTAAAGAQGVLAFALPAAGGRTLGVELVRGTNQAAAQ